MKKILVSLLCLSLLVCALVGTSYSWQGRMVGMGDPYGLLADESDFLIHPAKIAGGEGVRFYGDYQFTYTGVTDWDYNTDLYPVPVGPPALFTRYETSGDEQTHETLIGAALPLGPGRMGLFFEYTSMGGDYGGDVEYNLPFVNTYDLSSDLDEFAFRLLYGLPLGGFNLGGEIQLAYRQEENETELVRPQFAAVYLNNLFGSFGHIIGYDANLFPFMTPYDSSYWEALLKGSLEGSIGPVETAFTLRGGFIFGGENELAHVGGPPFFPAALDLDGDVDGWRLGGDLWLRFSLGDGLALPFLVRIDYQEKSRDGDGMWVPPVVPFSFEYENEESRFELEVGGGVSKEFAGGTNLAAGIYYNYLDAANDFELTAPLTNWLWDRSGYPDYSEHRFQVKFAGDFPLADSVALQLGLNFFYGWVREDYAYTASVGTPFVGGLVEDDSMDGSHWGFGLSMGASVALQRLTLEPFVGFAYQEITLEGDGTTNVFPLGRIEMDRATEEWSIGTGLSILFDL